MAERAAWDTGNRRERLFKRPPRRPRRGWIVLAVILVFVGIAWLWAFQRGPSAGAPGAVPLLRADNQPTRKRPDDPGGMKVADADNAVFGGEKHDDQVEHLLPPPEAPVPRPAADATNQIVPARVPVATQPAAAPSVATARAPWAPPPLHLAAASASGPPTSLMPGDQATTAPSPPSASAPPQTKPKPETAQHAAPPPAGKKAEAPPRSKVPPVAKTETPPPGKPVAQAKLDSTPPATGGRTFRLQVASVRSADAAKALWEHMKGGKDSDLLGALGYSVVTADLGARGIYYRIVAGPLASDRATQTCEELKRRGAGCILVKP
jgi:hypothetical protein